MSPKCGRVICSRSALGVSFNKHEVRASSDRCSAGLERAGAPSVHDRVVGDWAQFLVLRDFSVATPSKDPNPEQLAKELVKAPANARVFLKNLADHFGKE